MEPGFHLAKELLSYDIASCPPWKGSENISVKEMVRNIVALRKQYRDDQLPNSTIKKFRDDFIYQMSIDEGVGYTDKDRMVAATVEYESVRKPLQIFDSNVQQENMKQKEKSQPERFHLEHTNMLKAWKFLTNLRKGSEGILSLDIVLQTHEILMKGLKRDAGSLSNRNRSTVCPITEEEVDYPSPSFVQNNCQTLMDYANYMAVYIKQRMEVEVTEECVLDWIKFFAWFFSSFVQLHPFGDGNGRLSRLLYNYLQSFLTPFSVGVYNIHAPTNKNDYYTTIYHVREETRRSLAGLGNEFEKNNWRYKNQPSFLARMILECQWYAWKTFDKAIKDGKTDYKSQMESPPSSMEY